MKAVNEHPPGPRSQVETAPRRDSPSPWRAVRRFWRSVIAVILVSAGLGTVLSATTTPLYETTTTFFASPGTNTAASEALSADEFAQRRINSYIGIVTSERLAEQILEDTGLSLSTETLIEQIEATAQPDTVLLEVSVRDRDPQRSLSIAESLSENLDTAIRDIDQTGSDSEVRLTAISGPTLAVDPVVPRTALNLAVALALGLGLGLVQAVLREQLDQTVRNRQQLAALTGHPVLGVLSYDRKARRDPIVRNMQEQSRRAEAYRHLRTNLRFVRATTPAQTIVVTSTSEREGKSSTATNLAIALASSGSRVLLVDADLRRPTVDRFLDLEPSTGLTHVLLGEVPLERATQTYGRSGLDVLPTGPLPPNPSELLGGAGTARLINEASERYDMVVFDSPPLLPVTDAAVLALQCDGVLMVVRYGSTKRSHVLHCIELVTRGHSRLLGTVLTMSRDKGEREESSYYRSTSR